MNFENIKIRKVDGHYEYFSPVKLKKSIINSGGSEELADEIFAIILKEGVPKSTRGLYKRIYELILEKHSNVAARYSLKSAMHSLGPSGYPFEKYISAIYSHMGYDTKVNVKVQGSCVEHEMDVIAKMEEILIYIECKYHQSLSGKCNVKIPLYVKARTDDIKTFQEKIMPPETKFKFYVATNTRFTSDAIQYAYCNSLNLLSWNLPVEESLPKIIDNYGLHPVTVSTKLTNKQAVFLIDNGLELIYDLPDNVNLLRKMGIPNDQINDIVGEAEAILSLKSH